MRHSKIDLTMNVYTDPKLLDVYGALDSLPSLDLNASPSTERPMMRATGTHDAAAFAGATAKSFVAPNSGKLCRLLSFRQTMPVNGCDAGRVTKSPRNQAKKPCPQCLRTRLIEWRRPGSNRQPQACKASALPVELRPLKANTPYVFLRNK